MHTQETCVSEATCGNPQELRTAPTMNDENELLRDAAAANAAALNRRRVDSSHHREWRKFKDFVDEKRAIGDLPGEQGDVPYLTRLNVDLYFQVAVANWSEAQPRTARRCVAALLKMAQKDKNLSRTFQIDNGPDGHVARALEAQALRYIQRQIEARDQDAHAGLPTSVMTEEEYSRAVDFVF